MNCGCEFLEVFFSYLHTIIVSHRYNLKKLTYEERKAKLIERLNALNAAGRADEDENDEDDD